MGQRRTCLWFKYWCSVVGRSVEDLSVSRWSVVGGSVKELSVGRWSEVGGCWIDGESVSGSVDGGRWPLRGRWFCNTPVFQRSFGDSLYLIVQ